MTPTPTPTPTRRLAVDVDIALGVTVSFSVGLCVADAVPVRTSPGSPTASPSTGKSIETVPGGTISIACLGNKIANASATTTDPTYTLTPRSLVDPRIDVFFSKN